MSLVNNAELCLVCWLFQVQAASVLFVDNPVGTGFSYTDRPDAYATDVATVASDMLVLLRHFFKAKSEFQVRPSLGLTGAGHHNTTPQRST